MTVTQFAINAASIVSSFVGIGLFFDLVLLTKKTKTAIRKFITKRHNGNLETVFLSYVRLVHASVFERFFHTTFLSWRYFGTCCFVSIVSLVFIVAFQIIFGNLDHLEKIGDSSNQLTLLAVCIAFNVVVDWISIGQTQAFFAISSEQKKAWRAALLIISDFVLTINFFTILYSQLIAYVILFPTLISHKTELRASVVHDAARSIDKKAVQTIRTLTQESTGQGYVTTFRSLFLGKDGEPFDFVTLTAISNSNTLDLRDFFAAIYPIMPNRIEEFKTLGGDDEEKDKSEKERESLKVSFRPFSFSFQRTYAYTAAYRRIDDVQDEFPSSVLSGMTFISMDGLISAYHRNIYYREGETIVGCKSDKGEWKRAKTDNAKCETVVVVEVSQLGSLAGKIARLSSDDEDLFIPLNSLFLTSLSITAVIYLFALLLMLARVARGYLTAVGHRFERVVMKSPFACAGLVLGLAVFGLSLLS